MNKQPETAAVEETSAEEAEKIDNAEVSAERREAAAASYDVVVNKYVTALEDNSFNVENYSDMAVNLLNYYHMYHNSDFYYACYDIDGNGVDELIIGNRPKDYDGYSLVDLYAYNGNEAVRAIANNTFGDRSSLTILSDGTFCETSSGGADDTVSIYYRLSEDGYSTLAALESSAPEVTDFEWMKIDISAVENTPTEEIDFTGSFSNGAIDLKLYMDGNTLKMDFGDDVVMGRSTFTFTSFNVQGDELIACDEHETYYFTRNQDGSITLDTQGNVPEMEGVYDIQ